MRNRDRVWRQANNVEKRLEEMETSHLLNVVLYINKRLQEYDELHLEVMDSDMKLPTLTFNGEPGSIWKTRMLRELNRRAKNDEAADRKTLEALKEKLGEV